MSVFVETNKEAESIIHQKGYLNDSQIDIVKKEIYRDDTSMNEVQFDMMLLGFNVFKREHSNKITVFKDDRNMRWLYDIDGKLYEKKFGNIVLDIMNQLIMTHNKELFLSKESFFNSEDYGESLRISLANTDFTDSQTMSQDAYELLLTTRKRLDFDITYFFNMIDHIQELRTNKKYDDLDKIFNYFSVFDLKIFVSKNNFSPNSLLKKIYKNENQIKEIIEVDEERYKDDIKMISLEMAENVHKNKRTYIGPYALKINNAQEIIPVQEYNIQDAISLWCDDFFELLYTVPTDNIKKCSDCGAIFHASTGKYKYCKYCSSTKKDKQQELRKRTPRYKHTLIQNYLNNVFAGEYLEEFKEESNYYWCIVRGKTPKTKKKVFYKNIKTEEQYIEWLNDKHEEYKKEKAGT